MEDSNKRDSCDFCDITLPNLRKDMTFYISRGSNLMINDGGGYNYRNYDIWIKYCPMCGRKLNK